MLCFTVYRTAWRTFAQSYSVAASDKTQVRSTLPFLLGRCRRHIASGQDSVIACWLVKAGMFYPPLPS